MMTHRLESAGSDLTRRWRGVRLQWQQARSPARRLDQDMIAIRVVRRLAGRRVAVVEDDFYLADEMKDALERVGAIVDGPHVDAHQMLEGLWQRRCDCAVVDLNLGRGPTFRLTREILRLKIPVVICTGYDLEVIPPDLRHLSVLQKPVDLRRLVAAVYESCYL